VLLAGGDMTQASATAEHSLMVARALDNAPDIADAEVLQARLQLAQGDLAAAQRWLKTPTLPGDRQPSYTHQSRYLMHARISIARARHTPGSIDLGAVVAQLHQLLQLAEADQRMADRITTLGLLALAHDTEGASTQALQVLTAAIRLAAPEGYIRTFMDEGAPMRSLLQALRRQLPALARDEQKYVDRLLGSFPAHVSASFAAAQVPSLLSEREQAVLLLIAEGRSIAEIAAQLVISAHTARTHVKNIYLKLEAHNRVQALERARALQLLK
jgi:LuxR family transcriptional regulator, maltose regulon positive regulatory protein